MDGVSIVSSLPRASQTAQPLTLADLQMFSNLRIPETLLQRAGIVRVDSKQAFDEFGVDLHGDSGIGFPYYQRRLAQTPWRVTARVRHGHPPKDENGKLRKYESPTGDNRHLYFAPCDPR